MASSNDTSALIPEFVQTLFRSRQTLSQLYRLMDSHIAELYILMLLSEQDEEHKVYAMDIQNKLSASKAAVSGMLSSLEKRGFIMREINAENRRKVALSLTESGLTELEACRKPFNDLIVEILDTLGYENACSLMEQLELLSGVLEKIYSEKKG